MQAFHRHAACAALAGLPLLLAGAPLPAPDLVPVAETEDGFVFWLRKDSLLAHPLGHAATITARGTTPRLLRRSDPASPAFIAIESHWVADCAHGTFAIVRDRFFDASHATVAEFEGDAREQERPVRGSVSHMILHGICRQVHEGASRGQPPR